MAVSDSVDNLMVTVHHVGQGIGVINATTRAMNVIVFSMKVLVRNAYMECTVNIVVIHVVVHVLVNVEKVEDIAHLATSDIGETTVAQLATPGALGHVYNIMARALPVVTGSGETVVSMCAQTVHHPSVSNTMDNVYVA